MNEKSQGASENVKSTEEVTLADILNNEEFEQEALENLSAKQLERMQQLEILKMAYVQYFPLDGKYISLFVTPLEIESASNELQLLIFKRIQKAVESGETKRNKFELHMKDILPRKQSNFSQSKDANMEQGGLRVEVTHSQADEVEEEDEFFN